MPAGEGPPLVLLVEDSMVIREVTKQHLAAGGFEVAVAHDGGEAVRMFNELRPAVTVLDIELPVLDGFEVLERIRKADPRAPVLMLTGSAPEEASRVRGLVSGADDYVLKGVGGAELRARVKALLRRAGYAEPAEPAAEVFESGGLRVDWSATRVEVDGVEVALTPVEFRLLKVFTEHPGETLSRQQLLESVWNDFSGASGGDQVKVYVGYLRKKIGEERIETVRGFGYRFGG
jgi:DNA-binding response OmpR family regulator